MNLLAIETSSSIGSIALGRDGHVEQRLIESPREQTELALPLIEELLHAQELRLESLDALAFGRGPGAFTGLRIAAALAQGLGMSMGLPLVGVSSLAVAALGVCRKSGASRVLVCVDARMGEVYWAAFEARDGAVIALTDERIGRPADVDVPDSGPWVLAGDGLAAYPADVERFAAVTSRAMFEVVPSACNLLPLAERELAAGHTLTPDSARPIYLRDSSAWKPST